MGSPIGLFTGVTLEPVAGPVTGPALGDAAPFDVTLGVAIASAIPAPPPVVAEPLLELLLDGDWLPDEPSETEGSGRPVTGAAVGDQGREAAPTTASGEPMVLEKNLDSWLAAFGRRERQVRTADDTDIDPNSVQLDEPALVPAASPDRLTTIVPSIGVGTAIAADNQTAAATTGPREAPTRNLTEASWAGRRMFDGEDGLPDGLIDAETLLRTRRAYEPAVEVGGFGFPTLPDSPDAGVMLDGGDPRSRLPLADSALADGTPDPTVPVGRAALGARLEAPTAAADLLSVSRQAAAPDPRVSEIIAIRTLEGAKHQASGAAEPGLELVGRHPAIRSREGEQAPAGQSRSDSPPRDDSRFRGEPSAMPGDGPVRRRPGSEPSAEPPAGSGQVAAAPQPARGERSKAVDGPVALAQPTAFDRIARRIDHLTLDLKDDAGDYGRLRVSVSGPLVRATIMPNDPAMADRLNLEIRQLKTSLEERGFPEPKLTVLAPRATEPAAWVPVGREVVADAMPTAQTNTERRTSEDERRDRWAANRDQRRDEQRHQEHPRQPRRDQPGEPK